MPLRKKPSQRIPHADPVEKPDYVEADVHAIRACFRGTATPEQQRRAMEWIIVQNCCTYDLSFRPESDRLTNLAEGKRLAGMNIVYMLQYAPSRIDSDKISVRESMSHKLGEHRNAAEQAQ